MEKMNRQKDKIERIEVSIEYPKCMEGICRIESVCLFYEGIMESFDDQEMIDNSDFFSRNEIIETIAKKYGVSKNIIKVV